MQDSYYMQLALEASEKNIGITYPNPSVGCVIVKENQIIAIAATANGGRPHAETIALKIAGDNSKGSTMYVTLEPCCHWGITPPCIDAIIKANIRRVVIAIADIDVRVANRGIDALIKAGIDVNVGLHKKEAYEINKAYFKSKRLNIPYITLKIATSIDGKIALPNGKSKWITNELSRKFVHTLRAKHDAVLVGIGTIKKDDPILNSRIKGLEDYSPDIFVIDKNLEIKETNNVLSTLKTCYIITDIRYKESYKSDLLKNCGAKFIYLNLTDSYFDIDDVLKSINHMGITSLLIEGGASIFTWFIRNKLFDELIWINSNIILGNDSLAAIGELNLKEINNFKLKQKKSFTLDDDLVRIYENYK